MDLNMVSYLSELGKLEFNDSELKKVAEEMTNIINLMDTIKEIDISYDPLLDNKDIFLEDLREDIVRPSFSTEKVLANAVNSEKCFVVPKVVN